MVRGDDSGVPASSYHLSYLSFPRTKLFAASVFPSLRGALRWTTTVNLTIVELRSLGSALLESRLDVGVRLNKESQTVDILLIAGAAFAFYPAAFVHVLGCLLNSRERLL